MVPHSHAQGADSLDDWGAGHHPVVSGHIEPGRQSGAAGVTVPAGGSTSVFYKYCNGIYEGERTHHGHHFLSGNGAVIEITNDGTKLNGIGDGNDLTFGSDSIVNADVHLGGPNSTINMNGASQSANVVSTGASGGTINP